LFVPGLVFAANTIEECGTPTEEGMRYALWKRDPDREGGRCVLVGKDQNNITFDELLQAKNNAGESIFSDLESQNVRVGPINTTHLILLSNEAEVQKQEYQHLNTWKDVGSEQSPKGTSFEMKIFSTDDDRTRSNSVSNGIYPQDYRYKFHLDGSNVEYDFYLYFVGFGPVAETNTLRTSFDTDCVCDINLRYTGVDDILLCSGIELRKGYDRGSTQIFMNRAFLEDGIISDFCDRDRMANLVGGVPYALNDKCELATPVNLPANVEGSFTCKVAGIDSSLAFPTSTASTKPTGKVNYVELPNPLSGSYTLQQLLGFIAGRALGILGSLTLAVFVYGGFMYLTAAGNDEKVKRGTNAMVYAVIGIFIIFTAYVILNTVIRGVLGA